MTHRDHDLTTHTLIYDAQHRMASQVNTRGFRTQYVFNDFGQVVTAIRPDGSATVFAPDRSLGLVDPAGAEGTETTPLPVLLAADTVSTVRDGNGQPTTLEMDVFGAATTITDPLVTDPLLGTCRRVFNG